MNNWNRCKTRAEMMCKRFNLSCELSQGNGRNGIAYSITFYIGAKYLYELRDRSPSRLYDTLAAFDWGMETRENIYRERKPNA